MITLAAFFVERLGHPYWRDDYREMLILQRQSCQWFGVEHLVITDLETVLPCGFDRFAVPLPQSVMQASLVAQRMVMKTWKCGELILADADVVLTRDPREIFDGTFDIAVTTHPFLDSILNNGVMFVAQGCAAKAVPFWDDAISRVAGDEWGDDQAALRDAFDATLDHGVHRRRDARVRFLPCDGYNQAPEEIDDGIDSYFIHFRGDRKAWAKEWVARWI